MGIPTYLALSRHNVYYLRWPLPEALHPLGKASEIKVSLGTRDRREALHLSRLLAYVAQTLTSRATASGMRYDEMRAVIRRHFQILLAKRKDQIGTHGRLTPIDRAALENAQSFAEAPEGDEVYAGMSEDREAALGRFQALYGLALDRGSKEYQTLAAEFQRGYRDFAKAVLRYDRSLDGYSFEDDAAPGLSAHPAQASAERGTTLKQLADSYLEEGIIGGQWAAKTRGDKQEQFALLYEIIGPEVDVRAVTAGTARKVKEIILKYPKNRNKDARTRGLPLDAALAVKGVPTISVKTINTYLSAYSALFRWGRRNGYVEENVFAEMAVRDGRQHAKGEREAFNPEHCRLMLVELLNNERGLIRKDYQKWVRSLGSTPVRA